MSYPPNPYYDGGPVASRSPAPTAPLGDHGDRPLTNLFVVSACQCVMLGAGFFLGANSHRCPEPVPTPIRVEVVGLPVAPPSALPPTPLTPAPPPPPPVAEPPKPTRVAVAPAHVPMPRPIVSPTPDPDPDPFVAFMDARRRARGLASTLETRRP